jgi:hypothetical protein
VSTELNNLVAEGKVVKILGKPVRYLDRIWLEANAEIMIKDPIIKHDKDFKKLIMETALTYKAEEEIFSCNKNEIHHLIENHTNPQSDIFENIVGAGDDLNCADYAENLQLLVSHLFGSVKGAFTGADTEKRTRGSGEWRNFVFGRSASSAT